METTERIKWAEKVSNENVLKRIEVESSFMKMKKQLFGHTLVKNAFSKEGR